MRALTGKLLLLVVGLLLAVPAVPQLARAGTAARAEKAARADKAQTPPPPHVRRRRRPPPPRRPPVVRRVRPVRRVVPHHAVHPAQPRPRQTIVDPRTSIYFGLGPVVNFVVEGEDRISEVLDTGGGLELFLGFRFSKYAAFELGGLFSFHGTEDRFVDTGILNAITGDVKVFFVPSSRRIEPFFQLGAGAYLLARDGWDENEMTGGGIQVGAGVDIRLNRMVAIGTRFLYRGIFLDNSEAHYWIGAPYENAFLNVFTMSANLQFHF